MKITFAIVASMGIAASALAGTNAGTGTISLFGVNYTATQWVIAGDAGPGTTSFGAEGMTFFNGTLYVSHDHDANRAAGNLVSYVPGASGDLSAPSRTLMGNGPAGLWGPEGITVNTSGAGFGSFASGSAVRVTAIDTRGPGALGVFDTSAAGSAISPFVSPPGASLDDLAFVASLNRFAAIEDGAGNSAFLRYYDHTVTTMTIDASFSVPVIDGAKGIATVSAAFVQALTGLTISTSQALLVVSEFENLAVYDTTGALVGTPQNMNSFIPTAFQVESVAVDEANNRLYIGAEGGTSIFTLVVPAPGVAGVLGLGLVAAARRRRA
jgi:hypothetical protein